MSREQLAAYLRLQADLKDRTRTHLRSYHDPIQGKHADLSQAIIDGVREMVKQRAGVKRIRATLHIGTSTLRRALAALGLRPDEVCQKPGRKP
jgi:hypothetical protein